MAKVKVIKKTAQDKELLGAFNQMIGNGEIDPAIVSNKYENLYVYSNQCLLFLDAFSHQALPKVFHDYKSQFAEIKEWATQYQKDLLAFKINKLTELTPAQIMSGDIYDREALKQAYEGLKNSKIVKELLDIYIYLLPYKRHIENKDKLSWGFILTSPGSEFRPFACSYLNIKELAGSPAMNKSVQTYILTILHAVFENCSHIYQIMTSPDIDVNRMVDLLITNLKKVKGQIPDCDLAFKKLEGSVELLRNNFGKYYTECITSDNPSAIMENFINDVATETKADTKMMRQFHRIISFYQKNLKGKIQDPKLKEMYETVSKKYSDIEQLLKKGKDAENAEKSTEDEADDESSSESDEEKSDAS
ncbi:hypothetical protein BNJ_00435 [Kaumoebavirus]|uniref:hypothetical protein n=1 Tax=Kaumoebavirus TaxID=1859492 RepID=UPI0009C3D768|nr:hypothetical protein BNJ_00435 [Kaumoebavirus]ARA72247.1 hypothetical protein BNJ_00435 [Kaumoebavirus]